MLNLYAQVTPEPNELHKNEDFDIVTVRGLGYKGTMKHG